MWGDGAAVTFFSYLIFFLVCSGGSGSIAPECGCRWRRFPWEVFHQALPLFCFLVDGNIVQGSPLRPVTYEVRVCIR